MSAERDAHVRDVVRAFILKNHLPGESAINLRDDTRLQTSGILDSMSALALVSFVEGEFGVQLSAYKTTAESFDRIEDIARLVARKRETLPVS